MDYAVPLSCRAASVTLVVYDWLITLDREVDLIWPRRWSPAKSLFLFNRYFGPVCLVLVFVVMLFAKNSWGAKVSLMRLRAQDWCTGIVVWIWLLQFALLYRTFAIYSSTERIRILLIGGYIVGVCATVIILVVITLTGFKESDYWLPTSSALAYKFVFIALATRISIKHARFVRWLGRDHIVTWAGFVKDSIFYFSMTSIVVTINATVWLTLSPQWYRIFEGFSIAAICAAGNRLIFELVELYYAPSHDEQEDVDIPLQNVSGRCTVAGTYEQVTHDLNSSSSIIEHG